MPEDQAEEVDLEDIEEVEINNNNNNKMISKTKEGKDNNKILKTNNKIDFEFLIAAHIK